MELHVSFFLSLSLSSISLSLIFLTRTTFSRWPVLMFFFHSSSAGACNIIAVFFQWNIGIDLKSNCCLCITNMIHADMISIVLSRGEIGLGKK